MNALNRFASAYFSLILMTFCLIAFFTPAIQRGVSWIILSALFVIIFVSYFRLDLHIGKMQVEIKMAVWFMFLRFLVLPLIAYGVLYPFSPFYAFVFFFLLLMPSAVSSPAFTSLFGRNIRLSMLILLGTSFLAIFSVSVLTPLLSQPAIHIGMQRFLFTLLFSILLPFVLHLPFRRIKWFSKTMRENVPLITVLALSAIFLVAISSNRDLILQNPHNILVQFSLALLMYGFMYLTGWLLGSGKSSFVKLTFSVSSGMNNIGLAVSLAILYLSPQACIFLITAEFAWVGILLPIRRLWGRKHFDQEES